MNKLAVLCISTLFLNASVLAENNFTAGIGLGSLYGGLGINVGLHSETDFKYVSAGCVSVSSSGESCGFGIGYMTTSLINSDSKKHATNFYAGIVGTQRDYYEDKALYGIGLGYSFFFRGIDKSGGNVGFTILGAEKNDELEMGAMVQFGYQF